MTIANRWWHVVFREYLPTSESLSLFRLIFALVGLAMLPPQYQWIAGVPDSFLNPPPGMTYFLVTRIPPAWFFTTLDVTIIVALVYLLAGRRVVAASLLLTGCLLLGNSWAYSFGKIDHDILLVLTPLFLAAAGWDGTGRVRAWPMSLFALIIALAMFTAAVQKAFTGWLDPSTSATLGHLVRNRLVLQKGMPPVMTAAFDRTPWFIWELMDYATVLLEGAFILTYVDRRAFKLTCAIACLFHVGITATMRLVFAFNLAAYGAFVDWVPIAERCRVRVAISRVQQWLGRRSELELLMAALCLSIIVLVWTNPANALLRLLIPGGVAPAVVGAAGIGVLIFVASRIARWRPHEGRATTETTRAL